MARRGGTRKLPLKMEVRFARSGADADKLQPDLVGQCQGVSGEAIRRRPGCSIFAPLAMDVDDDDQ